MTNESFEAMARRKQHQRDSSQGVSQRQLRVGELVRHALAEMLMRGDVHDPVIEGHIITIPEVRVTADLRLATIYVMPMGGRVAPSPEPVTLVPVGPLTTGPVPAPPGTGSVWG